FQASTRYRTWQKFQSCARASWLSSIVPPTKRRERSSSIGAEALEICRDGSVTEILDRRFSDANVKSLTTLQVSDRAQRTRLEDLLLYVFAFRHKSKSRHHMPGHAAFAIRKGPHACGPFALSAIVAGADAGLRGHRNSGLTPPDTSSRAATDRCPSPRYARSACWRAPRRGFGRG